MKKLSSLLAAGVAAFLMMSPVAAQEAADLNDLEIAHVAYVADNIDIRYAHLALAISTNPAIHEFARTMIRDHSAVNDQALALLDKLGAEAQDNFLSQALLENADKLVDEMAGLRGAAFDKRYAENELAYHIAVNDLVENTFIPNIENAEVKALFEAGLEIFKAHQGHAAMMVEQVSQ
jgi:putative membrane protein